MTNPELAYHPYYCEENVWHLARHPMFAERPRDVVFISNPLQRVTMWHQRAGRGQSISWDYHVILLTRDRSDVWDLDTDLGLPIAARAYFEQSFRGGVPAGFEPWFRVVDAGEFVSVLASDRSHMANPKGGFERPPPPWKPIGASGAASNLMRFVDVTRPFVGTICRLEEMLETCATPSR